MILLTANGLAVRLPPILFLLRAGIGNEVVIEVFAQLSAHRVRGIALNPIQGLARGMLVQNTGGPLKVPVGKGILSRMFDVFAKTIDGLTSPVNIHWRSVHNVPPAPATK